MDGLQRVTGYFEIISKYLIVSLCEKNVHSVYQIFEGIHDPPPPQDVEIHYHKLGFLFYDDIFSKKRRCPWVTPSNMGVECISLGILMCTCIHIRVRTHSHANVYIHPRPHTCVHTRVPVSLEPPPHPSLSCSVEFQLKVPGGFILTFYTSDTCVAGQGRLSSLGSHPSCISKFQGQHVCGKEHEIQSQTDLGSYPRPTTDSPGT